MHRQEKVEEEFYISYFDMVFCFEADDILYCELDEQRKGQCRSK